MNKSFSITILALLCINSLVICQQGYVINSKTWELADNKGVLLDRSGINPSHLTDSGKILVTAFLHDQWCGQKSPNNGLFVKGETGLLPKNISAGILFDCENSGFLKYRSILGGVKKGISLGLFSTLNIGLNIGFYQARMDFGTLIVPQPDPIIDVETKWSNSPILDLGLVYTYKNQHIGLSYKNLVNSAFEVVPKDHQIRQSGFMADYQGVYSISNRISLIPEIYGCFTSTDRYAIAVAKISYKNILTAGLLYNSHKSYGFLISWIIIKKIRIGYFFDFEKNKVFNSDQITGSHGLNIGLILK
jgi:type IX secretion system PorP/SprF family membrane protein